MRKVIVFLSLLIALFTVSTHTTSASENVVSASGIIKTQVQEEQFDYRIVELRLFLEKLGSPLSIYAEDFVKYADMYQIDYRLVPAITGVESTFGKRIPKASYNAYGWANGAHKFTSWSDSISHVTMKLRYEYINKGANTIPKIARRYAPPSNTWASKVNYFVKKISASPLTYDI